MGACSLSVLVVVPEAECVVFSLYAYSKIPYSRNSHLGHYNLTAQRYDSAGIIINRRGADIIGGSLFYASMFATYTISVTPK